MLPSPRHQELLLPGIQTFYYGTEEEWLDGGTPGWDPRSRLAADSHANSHECPKRPTTLHHRFANSSHQLSSSHANPEKKKNTGITQKLKPVTDTQQQTSGTTR